MGQSVEKSLNAVSLKCLLWQIVEL